MSSSTSSSNTPPEQTLVQINDRIIGSLFDGKYKILSFIDKGGMGSIYRAQQISLNREVAIKLMQVPDDPTAEKRFFLEASMCAQLQHPNTIRIFEFGKSNDGHVYIVMELLKGLPLSTKIYNHGALESREALQICSQICSALEEAHQNGIVHRDIKPSNIFLHQPKNETFPKLIDFGLVKQIDKSSELSHTGLIMGSPMYMSPEQVDSREITLSTDIYSLGMTLYTMLTGAAPFKKDTISQILIAQIRNTPAPLAQVQPNLQFPAPIEWTIQTAIQKTPSQRFASMKDFQTALRYCLEALATRTDIFLFLENGQPKRASNLVSQTQTIGAPSLADFIPSPDTLEVPQTTNDLHPLSQSTYPEFGKSYPSGTLLNLNQAPPSHRKIIISAILTTISLALIVAVILFVGLTPNKPSTTLPPTQEIPAAEPITTAKPEQIKITLQSEPNHAEVYHDGEFLGNTPYLIRLEADEDLKVDVQLSGYLSKSITLNARSLQPTIYLTPKPQRQAPVQPTPAPQNTPVEPTPVESNESSAPQNNDIQTRDPWAD